MKKKKFKILLLILIILSLLGFGIYYWLYSLNFEKTDDAFLESDIVAVSPRISGYVEQVNVIDNQQVKAGDILVILDPKSLEVQLEQAKAQVTAAEADIERISGDLYRYQILIKRDEISKQKLSNTQAELKSAQARAKAAKARQEEIELNLTYTQVKAPWSGKVTKKSVQKGALVQVGQPLLTLVSPQLWVLANFKESQIKHMKPKQKVSIKIDAIGKSFQGHIESIQSGSGSRFSLFPPENATGNFVKVVQRVPVKIVFDEYPQELTQLGPGLSVVPEVTIK